MFSAFPIRQEQTNLSRDVCVLHPIVFTTVWSTPSPSSIWLGQLLSKLLKSFSWYVSSRINLDLYEAVTSIALVRNSTPSRSHSRVSPCPFACVTQSLTCPRPCSPTYETHIPACPKRERGWEHSFSFELHFALLIRDPTGHSIKGSWIPWGIWQTAERFPRDWTSSQHMLLGPIQLQQHSSFCVHRTRASPSSLCLTQTFCRPRTSPPSVPHCGDVEQLKFNLVLCLSRDHCSLILPHWHCPLIGSILEFHVICPLEPDTFHVLFPTVSFLCGQLIRTNCSSLQTFVAHLCETDIQVLETLRLSLLWCQFQSCTTLLLVSLM